MPTLQSWLWLLLVLPGFVASPALCETPEGQTTPVPFHISQVVSSPGKFNPAQGEKATISYTASESARTIVRLFDAEMRLVRELMAESRGPREPCRVVWDGRDAQGKIVPDEAYFFTIDAGNYQGQTTFYDPTTFSGGELVSPEGVRFDPEKNVVSYRLPKDARVTLRAGISGGGPLLKNILHSAPRSSGPQEEAWNGKDESGTVDVPSEKGYSLRVEAVNLPENTIIACGNKDWDYFRYKIDMAQERPKKVDRPFRGRLDRAPDTPPGAPVRIGPELRFRMELPEDLPPAETGVPIVSGRVPVRLWLDESIKRYATEQRYEILFFVDLHFVKEMEEGYSPVTLMWDSRETPNGSHVITVNVATLTGQVSTASARVMVLNDKR